MTDRAAMTKPIRRLLKRLGLGRPVESTPVSLVHARALGKPVIFCVNMERDPIQRRHRKGTFYEIAELTRLRAVFPTGGVFVDIGANIGNHTLFAALHLGAARVIPFEPNPRAYELLIQNVLVNALQDRVDLSRLGVGLADARSGGFAMEDRRRNLGGARMLAEAGDIEVYTASELLADDAPDLVKIDVEGMEMQVLAGLEPVVARCEPILMVEVLDSAEAAFTDWLDRNGYGVFARHKRYERNTNFMAAPRARVEALRAAYDGADGAAESILESEA